VAFTALPSSHARELGLDHTIPFNKTILNHCGAFDTTASVFTCPVDGIYAFMTAVIADIHQNTVTEIVLNGAPLVQAYSGASSVHGFDQGFNTVLTECRAGDRVWVKMHGNQGSTVLGYGWSSFSGFLVYLL